MNDDRERRIRITTIRAKCQPLTANNFLSSTLSSGGSTIRTKLARFRKSFVSNSSTNLVNGDKDGTRAIDMKRWMRASVPPGDRTLSPRRVDGLVRVIGRAQSASGS